MKIHTTYFWDHDQETVSQINVKFEDGRFILLDQSLYRFCVDTSTDLDNPDHRYGMWSVNGHGDTDWTAIPKECFPKKFLASLLLLGVP